MATVLDQATSVLPKINAATLGSWAYYGTLAILIILIIAGFFALWAWWFITKKRFNKIIIIWSKVDGRPKITGRDKAMERKIGDGGDTVFYWKKLKKIVPTPTIQTGDNTYWFTRRTDDGEYINIGLEDFDLKFREAKINFLDKETRYARASLQKLNKDRFNKETFWQKYGKDIMTIIFIVIISIMLLLLMGKFLEVAGRLDGIMKSSETMVEKVSTLLGSMDNLCSKSGVVKA
jgi:hypothetical protein